MSTRLATGGRLIDRAARLSFRFNGRPMTGFRGDTLASALLANDQMLLGRSFKYHRPRGVVAAGAEEPNALVGLGTGPGFEPNQRATTTELFAGLDCRSQNHWPSLGFDIGAVNAHLAALLPAGFYYKTFMYPRPLWKRLYEPLIRRSAGLGRAPTQPDADRYEHVHVHTDILIIGGGVAGLQAALVAGRSGARVLVIEQCAHWGGRAPVDDELIDDRPPGDWVAATLAALRAMDNVTLRQRTMGAGVYDHGFALGYERVGDHLDQRAGATGPRHRLWKIRAKQIVTATGAIERPLSFAGNDVPGVLLASALRDYLVNWGVSVGDRTVIVTNNDDAYRTALALVAAGQIVPRIVDARPAATGDLPQAARAAGIRVDCGRAIAAVRGTRRVRAVSLCTQAGEGAVLETIPCDAVAMSGGWSPVVHLWSHCGGKLRWDAPEALFRPDPAHPPTGADGAPFVIAAGAANGCLQTGAALVDATAAAGAALRALGHWAEDSVVPTVRAPAQAPLAPVWVMPQGAHESARHKIWVDFQNDVKLSDIQLAAREGYESVEHAKRYTTLGMATDQGKLSNINGLASISEVLSKEIPSVGTTTFRPPYTPISLAAIAGEARGPLFQPVRRSPMHDWHQDHGAQWEPVGAWRRPYAYPRAGESRADAVVREVKNVRQAIGLLDASTLGKILVQGPDAGAFLDLIYTNKMSSLKPGHCRYGLICNENGFLMDDGVVARLSPDSFLCHTTTGGAGHVHAHMEDWLQTEWWNLRVYAADLTEQYGQIVVAGPKARALLETFGGLDLSPDSLGHMRWCDGVLAGHEVRIYRISFSGELSYEIAVPADRAADLWATLAQAGKAFGAMPYGTEAMHVLRAEKGFIMIGEETDGTVIPQDLRLGWAVSAKKDDFIGKRAQQRPDLVRAGRWTLVGLQALDGAVLPEGGYVLGTGMDANGQRVADGRVTSTYYSPTRGQGIAMALLAGGAARQGELVQVARLDGGTHSARVVDPVFYDKDGGRLHV